MRGGEDLGDLARDVDETFFEPPGADVLLGHSLGALTALEICRNHGDAARSLVLEEPPGSESTDFEEIASEMETGAAVAGESPEALVQRYLDENPSWMEEDAMNCVAGLRDCDAGPVAGLIRAGMRFDLAGLAGSVAVPTLLVLGSEERGSALPSPEREAVAGSLERGTVEKFEAGHGVHRDDFEGYVRLLGRWLGGPAS